MPLVLKIFKKSITQNYEIIIKKTYALKHHLHFFLYHGQNII